MSNINQYDVVIAGAGVAGALIAKQLTQAGFKVLVLEAGTASAQSLAGYNKHLETFYQASAKGPESPWPAHPNAPQPDTANLRLNNGYFVQNGPELYGSSYTRSQGGSTLHWLGVSLRMLPEDFQLKNRYGVGRNWPIQYQDLEPYYRAAEFELGVSADVVEQQYHDIYFADNYDYPMEKLPLSYSDQVLAKAINGLQVSLGGEEVQLNVRSYPAARNSKPRGDYVPVGAVDRRDNGFYVPTSLGQRCQGNTSCTPICPVQAKYNAGKSLAQAKQENLTLQSQSVVSKVNIDTHSGKVQSIVYQQYDQQGITLKSAQGKLYILASHAVENAKILLASEIPNINPWLGKHLMDHPTLYAYGLAPEPIGAYRGPQSTAGIEDARGGKFRSQHAAFRFDVGNDGWRSTTGAPDSAVADAVKEQLYGKRLRQHLAEQFNRHVRFSLAIEQLPNPSNSVSLDYRFVDPLGNPRPLLNYHIDEYTLKGMLAATKVYQAIFQKASIEDKTDSKLTAWFPSVTYKHDGQEHVFHYHGMGHFAGTHLMGVNAEESVVNSYQQSWNHNNLFLVGSGSFPTLGTSNPTLTLSALALRTANYIIDNFNVAWN
jgi:choline dehydrogenase-like flavoprotein